MAGEPGGVAASTPRRATTSTTGAPPLSEEAVAAKRRAALEFSREKSRRATALLAAQRRATAAASPSYAFGSKTRTPPDARRPRATNGHKGRTYQEILSGGGGRDDGGRRRREARRRVDAEADEAHVVRELYAGARVDVFDRKGRPRRLDCGRLRYLGPTTFSSGRQVWCGIELDMAFGAHDGEVEGTRYFGPTAALSGLMVPAELVKCVPGQPTAEAFAATEAAERAADAADEALAKLRAMPELAKYFKMLGVGVPRSAVAQKMAADGVAGALCDAMEGKAAASGAPAGGAKAATAGAPATAASAPSKKTFRAALEPARRAAAALSLYGVRSRASTLGAAAFDARGRDAARLRVAFGKREVPAVVQRHAGSRRLTFGGVAAALSLGGRRARHRAARPRETLDGRRTMNVSIMLGKLVGDGEKFASPRAVCRALMRCGDDDMTADQLELVLSMAPTPKERDMLAGRFDAAGAYAQDGAEPAVPPPEAMLAEIGAVPLYRERADAELLVRTALPRLAVVLADAALRVKACRCVVGSDSLRRCLETFLGVTNAMRVTESRGIELGSLLALARAKADDAAAVNAGGTDFEGAPRRAGRKRTFLDFVVETLCARGERGALGFAAPFARGDVVVAARPRRRRRLDAGKRVTLSDDDSGDESCGGFEDDDYNSSDSDDDDGDDDDDDDAEAARRERAAARRLLRAARWLPGAFLARDNGTVTACAEAVVARSRLHGGLARAASRASRASSRSSSAPSGAASRPRAVAAADVEASVIAEREAAQKAAKAALDAEKARVEAALRAPRSGGPGGGGDGRGGRRERARIRFGHWRARRGALTALGKPRTEPREWARQRREKMERAAALRAQRNDVRADDGEERDDGSGSVESSRSWASSAKSGQNPGGVANGSTFLSRMRQQPRRKVRAYVRPPCSWRPPPRVAAALLACADCECATDGALAAGFVWAGHVLEDRAERVAHARDVEAQLEAKRLEEQQRRLSGRRPPPSSYAYARPKPEPEKPPAREPKSTYARKRAAPPEDPLLVDPTDVKNPFFGFVERFLSLATPAMALFDAGDRRLAAAAAGASDLRARASKANSPRAAPKKQRSTAAKLFRSAESDDPRGALAAMSPPTRPWRPWATSRASPRRRSPAGPRTRHARQRRRRRRRPLRVGDVVLTRFGAGVVEARRPAATAAAPRRVVVRCLGWRAKVELEKGDVARPPCAVGTRLGPATLLNAARTLGGAAPRRGASGGGRRPRAEAPAAGDGGADDGAADDASDRSDRGSDPPSRRASRASNDDSSDVSDIEALGSFLEI
ncbi:hypothetical protein JL722_2407 [Aureococcus anophagefferens]|nr:hypothetical protein JL722_2407 [Aureococcus anophagefferens]